MNFDLSDEQKMLAGQARRLLDKVSTPDRLRALIDSHAEWDEPLWRQLNDMGLLGIVIPQEFGGLGMTELDRAVISEELGRANAAVPFFSSSVMAADAIRLVGSNEQKAKWLPRIACGETVATFAYAEGSRGLSAHGIETEIRDDRVFGFKSPVADAGVASLAVIFAKRAGKTVFAIADLAAPGVTRSKLDGFDQLRAHYKLSFDGVEAECLSAGGDQALMSLFDRAAVQAAFEAVGGAEACLYMARDYALERRIFGRPLGSYQAIKHRLADILVTIELARSSAYYAAWAVDSLPTATAQAAAAARLIATAAFEHAARENLQIHGGIGYTFEANCHFYLRRERTLAMSLGSRERWAARMIDSLLAESSNARVT